MINFFLYFTTVLIWGSTWLAIQFQLGSVSPIWSLIYRFGLAAILLLMYCKIKKLNMRFTRKQHLLMFGQGVFLFSVNYLLFYLGSSYFISGLVSIIFALIILMNILNSRIFLKTPLSLKVFIGALFGISGLYLVLSSQFPKLSIHTLLTQLHFTTGLTLCLAGTLISSFGNIISAFSQRTEIPIVQNNTYGMFYGVLILIIIAAFSGEKPSFDFSMSYSISLLYLAIFGSLLAFGAYLRLLGRIGPGPAAYAFVMLPIVSLVISTIYESFTWTQMTFLGAFFIILGNLLTLLPKKNS